MARFGAGFGFGLTRRVSRLGSGAPALASLMIQSATAMTDSIDGNGWIANVTLPSTSLGQAADASKLTLIVEEPGYDSTAAATTVQRTFGAGAQLRRAAPNDASKIEAASGADAVISFTLYKRVYSAARLVSASVTSGLYGSSAAGALTVNTTAGASGSALAYSAGTGGWFTPQFCAPTGTHFNVEFAAIHHEARQGRTYACVEFLVETLAGVDQGISVKVAAMTESVHTASASPAPCYAAAIPMAGLTQGTRYIVRAKAYPWIGDSTAVLDTGALSGSPASARPLVSLTFVCDKDGTYGNVAAFVKVGASGGTVGTTADLAGARATPFPTIAAAAAAIKTANNAKTGGDSHNDAGGGNIYLMETTSGAGADHAGMGLSTMATSTTGAVAWLNIRVDPAATGTVRLVTGSQKNPGHCTRWIDLTIAQATVAGNINDYIILDSGDSSAGNLRPIWLDGCGHAAAATNTAASPFARFGLGYVTRGTYSGMALMFFAPVGNVRSQLALCLGATITSFKCFPYIIAGCIFPSGAQLVTWGTAAADHNDGFIVAFNQFRNQTQNIFLAQSGSYAYAAFAGNLVEIINNGNNAAVTFGGDNSSADIAASCIMSNTIVGERINYNYTSSGAGANLAKKGVARDNIFEWRNVKSEKFHSTSNGGASGVGRTSNWECRFGVDNRNNVARAGASDGQPPSVGGWIGELVEPNSDVSASITFTDDKSKNQGGGAGGGAYTLTGAINDAYDRIPAGEAAWPFDLARVTRRNDGTGAAGAYER